MKKNNRRWGFRSRYRSSIRCHYSGISWGTYRTYDKENDQ